MGMSSDRSFQRPYSFDYLDPSLLAVPNSPFHDGCDPQIQPLPSSATPFSYEMDFEFESHATPFRSVDSTTASRLASAISATSHQEPLSHHSLGYFDTLESFSYLPFSPNCEPVGTHSACPSPVLPAFDLMPQQERAMSQPPEEVPFPNANEKSTPNPTQSMSFHRIVQPRGKRAHTYHPYSRRHESCSKRKTAVKSNAPTSAPKIISVGQNTTAKGANSNDSSPQNASHDLTHPKREQIPRDKSVQEHQRVLRAMDPMSPSYIVDHPNLSPQVGISSLLHSKPPADSSEANSPIAKEILRDLGQDHIQQVMMEMPLSLKLASYIHSITQMCSEMHSSLREILSINHTGGDIDGRLKLER